MDLCLAEIRDEAALRALLAVAVADATPEETMPPFEGPPGWTDRKQEFFMEFFLPMVRSEETAVFAVKVDGAVAGFFRLRRMPDADGTVAETGTWLGRSYRGKGIGAAAFDAVLAEAARRGYTRVVADTTPQNVAALGLLRRGRARLRQEAGKIYAEIAIGPGYATDLDK
jgi:RimJ/RimL family protein N-acetyltransferase